MSDLTGLLHRLAAAVHRPADPRSRPGRGYRRAGRGAGADDPAAPAPVPRQSLCPTRTHPPIPRRPGAVRHRVAPEGASFPVQPGPSA